MNKTWKPAVAGILDIASGILWILGVVLITFLAFAITAAFDGPGGYARPGLWLAMGALSLLGVAAIVGGIMSLRRKRWGIALAGSICAIPIGLGIASTILVAMAAKEFERPAR